MTRRVKTNREMHGGGFEDDANMSEDNEVAIPDDEDTASEDEDTSSDEYEENRENALKKFELVICVNLKEVSKCQSLRDVISHCNIFPEEEEALTEGLLKKVLLLFDGYDEYCCGSNSEIYEIFRGEKLRNCCVLITTGISQGDELREFKDVLVEITGFSREEREAFISRMLGSETEAKELRRHLSQENLEDLASVPEAFSCSLFKVQDVKEILSEIGKVALECLLKDDHVFEYDQLSAAILCKESLITGLLQVIKYTENLRPAVMVSFIHKSIQEFLAAWYITYRCVPEGNLGGIEEHAPTLEDCIALENVFQFICGLSDDGAVKVLEHLMSVRISDPSLDLLKIIPDEENETDLPCCDVTDKRKKFSDLVYNCFQEVYSKAELLSHCFRCTGGGTVGQEDEIQLERNLLEDHNEDTKYQHEVRIKPFAGNLAS
ncbi:Nlrc4p [Desmophyllum pertusum]|uniref:Nlrc4p n=1 Tax=Desmophyllum pertusum TaxID=174260 RepID=A0A9W9YKY1_9CNID|nr:Nlrc4p [Desmophyllum pertusum]